MKRAAYGRIRVLGLGGVFLELTEDQQRTIDNLSRRETAKAKHRPVKIGRAARAYRVTDYRRK